MFPLHKKSNHLNHKIMKTTGQILLGILAAASAGVVIGLLIAPEKGEDLRKDIKNSAGDLAKKLGDLLARGKEQYESLKSQLGEEADEIKQSAEETYRNANV
jgi:gas vesicle protein